MNFNKFNRLGRFIWFGAVLGLMAAGSASAKSAQEIDIEVNATLEAFASQVKGGKEFLEKSKGVLVFPKVGKAGLVIGGAYGEGAMRIGGQTVDYYSTAAASIGLQIGVQTRSEIVVFLEQGVLEKFRASKGWEAGVDGSIAVVQWGAGEDLGTVEIKDPIVAFIFGNKGLMANLSLEGSKYTKLNRTATGESASEAKADTEAETK
jgi:lipid-binding SYLF domain-containing protein